MTTLHTIMKQITNIEINSFRGIKQLSLNNLRPITIFLGENSVGKSAILESLFMITGPSNPFMPIRITAFRAHNNIGIKEVNYMFYDSDLSRIPSLKANLGDSETRLLSLKPTYSLVESTQVDDISSLSNNTPIITGLNCKFEIVNEQGAYKGESSFIRNQEGTLDPQIDSIYKEEIESVILSSYNQISLVDSYDMLVKSGKKDIILNALKNFDGRITSIESTKNGLFVGYQQLQNMVPLNMAGDGIQKYLSVAIHAYRPSTDIIIIDEIENGLHFSAHQKLWKCIIDTARDLGKQFFISTHNQETLKCLSSLIENEETSKMVSVVTLARAGDVLTPYYLSGYGLNGAIDNNVEIRK